MIQSTDERHRDAMKYLAEAAFRRGMARAFDDQVDHITRTFTADSEPSQAALAHTLHELAGFAERARTSAASLERRAAFLQDVLDAAR